MAKSQPVCRTPLELLQEQSYDSRNTQIISSNPTARANLEMLPVLSSDDRSAKNYLSYNFKIF
jgi:hypothetical protein